jgi:hypothetical protein
MGRLLQAAVLVASMAGIAYAKPVTRKYKVETNPPGATVYIDDVQNGMACPKTPCTIEVPLNAQTLIIQLAGYEAELMPIEVTKGKRAVPVSATLKPAKGVIRVDAPKGASVRINDELKGKVGTAPLEIEVPAEPASVVITYNGKTQTELVEVEPGKQVEIEFKRSSGSTTPVASGGNGGNGGDGGDGGDEGVDDPGDDETTEGGDGPTDTGEDDGAPTTPAVREPRFEGGLALDIGFRKFQYTGTQPYNNSGQAVVGPAVEVWPGRLLGVAPLRGLSLFARVQFGINSQQVTRESMGMTTDVGASTLWGALEVSVRQKFIVGGSFGAEVSAGFVRDQVEFNADNQTAFEMVPSADYKSLRIGARLSYVAQFEPYAGGEYRSVFSGGDIGTRADQASTSGYALRAGVRTAFGSISARAEFSYAKYTWQFTNSGTTTGPQGADDTIMWLGAFAGYGF